MKGDLRRLLNEFLKETRNERTEMKTTQDTESSSAVVSMSFREPTLMDLIYWLNDQE